MRIDWNQFQCAIFDLDGTLLDSTGVWDKIDIDFLGKRGITVPDDYIRDIKLHNFQTGSVYTVQRFGLPESPEEIAAEWMDMARKEYELTVPLKSHAKELLLYLKERGLKLSVATASSSELYETCLKRNGIYDLFDYFTETSEVDKGKGFPDVYERAASKCNTPVHQCIVFEDILQGVRGAKSGGFFTAAVYDHASEQDLEIIKAESDIYIYNYADLL